MTFSPSFSQPFLSDPFPVVLYTRMSAIRGGSVYGGKRRRVTHRLTFIGPARMRTRRYD